MLVEVVAGAGTTFGSMALDGFLGSLLSVFVLLAGGRKQAAAERAHEPEAPSGGQVVPAAGPAVIEAPAPGKLGAAWRTGQFSNCCLRGRRPQGVLRER